MMDKITVASVNCRGLGNVQKKKRRISLFATKPLFHNYFFYKTLIWTLNSTNTSHRNGVLLRIFVPIIQDLEVWPYSSIMILNSRSRGYLGPMEEIS